MLTLGHLNIYPPTTDPVQCANSSEEACESEDAEDSNNSQGIQSDSQGQSREADGGVDANERDASRSEAEENNNNDSNSDGESDSSEGGGDDEYSDSQGNLQGFVVSDDEMSQAKVAELQAQKEKVIKRHVYHPESFSLVVRNELRLVTFPGHPEEPGLRLAEEAIYGGMKLLGHNIPLHRAVITLNESQSYHKWLFGKYMDVLAPARRLNRGKSFRLDSKYGFDADRVTTALLDLHPDPAAVESDIGESYVVRGAARPSHSGRFNPRYTCYTCKEVGHCSNACLNTTCHKCKERGHYANHCPELQLRHACQYCDQLGHDVGVCKERRQL
ncbi:MAG: hypothetical protein WDW38_000025 [Sanguina aurantia]